MLDSLTTKDSFSIQPSISLPNFDHTVDIMRRPINTGSRLDIMSSSPNEREQETNSIAHTGFFADNQRLNIQPSFSLPNFDHTEQTMRRNIITGNRLDMSFAPNEREQETLIKSRNFEQALDLTSTTSFTQENHENKSHLFPLSNAKDLQSTFPINNVTETQREQRENVARYFTLLYFTLLYFFTKLAVLLISFPFLLFFKIWT